MTVTDERRGAWAGDVQSTPDLDLIASTWLSSFGDALAAQDGASAAALFTPEGWWRDLLSLTFDLRTAHGSSAIAALVESVSTDAVRMQLTPGATLVNAAGQQWLQAMFTFTAGPFAGNGVLRLVEHDGTWLGWTALTAAQELIGHEEAVGARRPDGGAQGSDRLARNWAQQRAREVEFVDADPDVVVIGGGHSGLGLAARLGRMDVPTLVVDSADRIGDGWRARYDSLVLHDPVWTNHLPYLPFPSSWPIYTPKDKVADWLESYATHLDLNVWTGSTLISSAHDPATGTWTLEIRRPDGTVRTLHPRHLVLATGISGTEPNLPEFTDSDLFEGSLVHTSAFPKNADVAGRRAIVVGSCNSGHDVAQELHELGAEVTMLQRSPTRVVSIGATRTLMADMFAEKSPPTAVADLLQASFPHLAAPEVKKVAGDAIDAHDADLQAGLTAAGFALLPRDAEGAALLYLTRGGGYYLNVGCSELIVDGSIGLRSGVTIERFTADGVVLSSGEALSADLVVLATGYRGIVDTARRVLGEEITRQVGPVWGLDDEGELQGVWRRSGHQGLWFMGGNLQMARYYGTFLALQIKADLEGLTPA